MRQRMYVLVLRLLNQVAMVESSYRLQSGWWRRYVESVYGLLIECSAESARPRRHAEWTELSRAPGHGPYPLDEPEGVGTVVYDLGDLEDQFELSMEEYHLCLQYYYLRALHFPASEPAREDRLQSTRGQGAGLNSVLQFSARVRGGSPGHFGSPPVPVLPPTAPRFSSVRG